MDQYLKKIQNTQTLEELEQVRVDLLGRNGQINKLFSELKTHPDPKTYGQELNQLKKSLEIAIETRLSELVLESGSSFKIKNLKLASNYFTPVKLGHLHPISITEREIYSVFKELGFSQYDSPELETDEYNFTRLNVPQNHPARDMQDSLYIHQPEFLLRTQTSSIEARLLQNEKPPYKAMFPGRVYRNEKPTKSNHFVFHQFQGVVVDTDITLKDLFGTFTKLIRHLYGNQQEFRFRNKYYPEVEPGVGIDFKCFNCGGAGCAICKGAGWMEMGGAGIIHPNVLKMANLDPKKWRGFAFGCGLDRWVMTKYKITDIRTLLGGNLAYKPYEL